MYEPKLYMNGLLQSWRYLGGLEIQDGWCHRTLIFYIRHNVKMNKSIVLESTYMIYTWLLDGPLQTPTTAGQI
jgi:hypothetical protein